MALRAIRMDVNGGKDGLQQGSCRAYGTAVCVAVEPLIELPLYHSVICIIHCRGHRSVQTTVTLNQTLN